MKPIVVNAQPDSFTAGVSAFFASLTWTYLRHRYPTQGQGRLLLALTLSGLDAWWWESCAMYLVKHRPHEQDVMQRFLQMDESPEVMRSLVGEIWTVAASVGANVGQPPIAPTYLTPYAITQEQYVTTMQAVYTEKVDAVYLAPWPDTPLTLQKPLIQPVLLEQAIAIMGATAGAIERLLAQGGHDDNNNT